MQRAGEILLTTGLLGRRFDAAEHQPLTDEDRMKMSQAKADRVNAERGSLTDYDCPDCLNRGYFAKVAYDERWGMIREYAQDCKCMKIRRAIWKMKASGLESSIRRCRFDTYEATEQWQIDLLNLAKGYAEKPTGWLFMGGQVGCGKSHLCTAVCRELLLKGIGVIYMPWQTDITNLKACSMDTETYDRKINALKTAEVLYIDDFFKPAQGQEPSPADVRIAYDIINYRYINQLPTIISSEHNALELVYIDEATGSRVYEMSKGHNMSVRRSPERNYRLKGATEK